MPDFAGNAEAIRTVVEARPDILAHNVETVPRLYPTVRPQADYRQSLEVLRSAGYRSVVIVPWRSGEQVVGTGTLVMAESNRRFRDLLYADGFWWDVWSTFRDERRLARARWWLAEAGLRPATAFDEPTRETGPSS